MKKVFYIISSAALIFAVSSCSKNDIQVQPDGVKMVKATIKAESTDSGVKTTATEVDNIYKINWEQGDELSVFNSSTKDPMTKFTATEAGPSTTFIGEIPEGSKVKYAILPYDAKAKVSGNIVYTTVPYEQDGKFGSVILAGWPKPATKAESTYDFDYQFEAMSSIVKFHFDPGRIKDAKTITRIVLISDRPISGSAKITYPESGKPFMTPNPISSAANVYNAVTILKPEGFKEGDYYIAVFPISVADDVENMRITMRFETSDGNVAYNNASLKAVVKEGNRHIFAANIVKNIGNVKVTEYLPHGFTEKEFSVSEDKKIYFSPGNLQYQASGNNGTGLWRFALNQWDAQGELGNSTAPVNMSGDEGERARQSEWIDLFPWGHTGWADNDRTYYPYSSGNNQNPYCGYHYDKFTDNTDWGKKCKILNGEVEDPAGTWRVLTQEEWNYLLCMDNGDPGNIDYKKGRSNLMKKDTGIEGTGKARYLVFMKIGVNTGVFVEGKEIIRYGLLLFPDGFEWPSAITKPLKKFYSWSGADFYPTERIQNYDPALRYSLTDFVIFEQAGCVFLPAAGKRSAAGSGDVAISINSFNAGAHYWCAQPYNYQSHLAVYIRQISFENGGSSPTHARSVRLVKDVVPAPTE